MEGDDNVEVFFGKVSRGELLHNMPERLKLNEKSRLTICSTRREQENADELNTSLKIIEQNSEPDLVIPHSPDNVNQHSANGEDSFLKIEKMISALELSKHNNHNLDNTMNIKDLILKSANIESGHIDQELNKSPKKESNPSIMKLSSPPGSQYCTPVKEVKNTKTEIFSTPSNKLLEKSICFKTPANPVSSKNFKCDSLQKKRLKSPNHLSTKKQCASILKTPVKSSSYQHIASPIAAYIKNTQIPLIQNVVPKKPLPGCSSIPKLVKPKIANKENINLPSLAYKPAKTTKVIDVSEKEKLPQSISAMKITSSLSKPLVLRHVQREISSVKKPLTFNKEDSFANLSLRQADVSLCTQKSAYNKLNK